MPQVFSSFLCSSLRSIVVATCVPKSDFRPYIYSAYVSVRKMSGKNHENQFHKFRDKAANSYIFHITGTSPCIVCLNFKWVHVTWHYTVLMFLCCCSVTVYLVLLQCYCVPCAVAVLLCTSAS